MATQNRWNDSEAAKWQDPLSQRVYTSRLLGQDAGLVMHGGGNTSVKHTATNLLGEKEEVIYIKGSGWDLATIEDKGFPAVRMPHLLKLRALKSMTDPEMMNELRTQLLDSKAPDPSVETLLHAFLPHRFVDHTHADAVLTLTNQPEGERWIRELYGKRVGIVPYVMPGFQLAKLCAEVYERDPSVEGLVLLKHGIFSFGETARQSYERMIELVNLAEQFLEERTKSRSLPMAKQGKRLARTEVALWTNALRAEYRKRGKTGILLLNETQAALDFLGREDLAKIALRGPLTPDHVIRTKRVPLLVNTQEAPATAVAQALDRFAEEYTSYFKRNREAKREDKIMLDPLPRVALLPGVGVVTFGTSYKEARIAMDIYEHTWSVIAQAERMSSFEALPEGDIYDVEYWVLEQAKLKLGAKTQPLSGKVAVISGATTGIGLGIAQEFLENGAEVFVLDIDERKFESTQTALGQRAKAGNRPQLIKCDVTDRQAMEAAVTDIVAQRGGIDIVVANAGIFPGAHPVEAIPSEEWQRTLNVNLTGTFNLLGATLPWMKRQAAGGDIILIASKNVPAPGKEAAAYSVSKAAQVQLARVTALEAGAHGIRVNMLHPHLVFDTALWTEELLASRAQAYQMTVEQYKRNNLLKTEIASRDVAKAAFALAAGFFSKTTGAQIAVDGGSDRTL